MGAGIRLGDITTVGADHRKKYRTFSSLSFDHAFTHGERGGRYHGNHHRFWGWLTRNEERMRFGLEMRERAAKERRRERRRRLRRLEEEGLAIRLGRSLRAH